MKDNWKIVITPNGDDKLDINYEVDNDEALADAKDALVHLSVSGVPEDLVEDTVVIYKGAKLDMKDFLILIAAAKFFNQMEPDEVEVFLAEAKTDAHRGHVALEGDPAIEAYLKEHPEERAKMDRIRELDTVEDDTVQKPN